MESNGSVDQVLEIWETCPNAYCAMIITDEDATTRSKLTHCMAELVANNRMTEAERRNKPLKEGNLGTKKGDHGVLPLDHPEIEKLSDPIHFIKNYKSELYKLVRKGLKTSETCKPDATRLSRNLAYMLAQHTPGRGENKIEDCTFEKFLTAGEASFEHHWNNHDHCGPWCSAKDWTVEENEMRKGKYRNKGTHAKEYEQQRAVKDKFMSEPRMRRCFHQFCNNKTEQIHGFVVNVFLPKNSFFCTTICGRARTWLACSLDSLGFEEYYRELYLELGIRMSTVTDTYYKQHDRKRKSSAAYKKRPDRRVIRAKRKLECISKEWKRQVQDRAEGSTYQSRVATGMESGVVKSRPKKKKKSSSSGGVADSRKFCKTCQNYGHVRVSSMKCTRNPKSKNYEGKSVSCVLLVYWGIWSKYPYYGSVQVSTDLSLPFYM
jgi:hypothetical protein